MFLLIGNICTFLNNEAILNAYSYRQCKLIDLTKLFKGKDIIEIVTIFKAYSSHSETPLIKCELVYAYIHLWVHLPTLLSLII